MAVNDFFEKDAFANLCGIRLLEAGNGAARAKLEIRAEHLNSHGILHGGAIFALADAVFAAASNSHDHMAVAININISYLKAVQEGTLIAEAKEINRDGKIGNYSVIVKDDQENVISVFEGLAYRKISQPKPKNKD